MNPSETLNHRQVYANSKQFLPNPSMGPVDASFRNIGAPSDDQGVINQPISKWDDRAWIIISVTIICAIVIVAGIVIAAVFAGIASQKNCPDCVCPTPLTNTESLKVENLYKKGVENQNVLIEKLTAGKSFSYNKCVDQCYNNFVTCEQSKRPDDCKRKTSITRDCESMAMCLDKCNNFCPIEEHREQVSENDKCINKWNFFEVCPSSEESLQ